MMRQPLIFDIKRFAINDGPGIRTTIFFKGCPLSCRWCHNPESQSAGVQKLYTRSRCIGCGSCVDACEQDACRLTPGGIVTDAAACIRCGRCAEVCPTKATEMSGRALSREELLALIEKERIFYEQSGGGVTFSGGEPLLYPGFLIGMLDALGERNIHRVVDTSGYAGRKTLLEVAQRTDLFLYDLKMMNPEKHRQYTGVDNRLILENLRALAKQGSNINIRIPLIAGVNDDEENIRATIAFIAALPGPEKKVNILPYHNIAAKKYEKLGGEYPGNGMAEPSGEMQQQVVNLFSEYGLEAMLGG